MPAPIQAGYGSTTSSEAIHTLRGRIEAFAASDVFIGAAVKWATASITTASISTLNTSPGFQVVMCASSNDEPLGFARDNAQAGQPIAILDYGNIVRETVQGSVNLGQKVGVISASPAVHPLSGVTSYVPNIGQVVAASVSSGQVGSANSFNAVWSVGDALDIGNPGQGVAIRINPRLLSGLI
jgi:hypothetical protein